MRISVLSCILLYLFVTSVCSHDKELNRIKNFADQLYQEGEYYRAITEYKRLMAYFPSLQDSFYSEIADCYFQGQQYEQALFLFKTAVNHSASKDHKNYLQFQMSRCYYQLNDFEMCEKILMDFTQSQSSYYPGIAKYMLGYVEAQKFNWQKSADWLGGLQNNHKLYENAQQLSTQIIEGKNLRQKNPYMAGVFSAVIPGTGYAYTGNYKIGAASLIINALFVFSAYEAFHEKLYVTGSTFTLLGLGWYSDNIYDSISKAHQYNRNIKINFVKNLNFQFFLNEMFK